MAATPVSRTSERFCAPDADLTVSSCDGVLFKVHRKHLEVHSDVFANAANATRPENGNEIVHLPESADVLDVLFQYMYRQPQPDLRLVKFPVFIGLAEAAEKYVVYSALPAIMIQIQQHVTQHPLEVLNFAAKHDHKRLGNEAARLSVGLPMLDAATILAPDTLREWMKYYDKWHAAARNETSRLIMCVSTHNRGSFGSSLAECARNPQMWYEQCSKLNLYGEVQFLDIEFMPSSTSSPKLESEY